MEDRFVELRRGGEGSGRDPGGGVALDHVKVTERVEESAPGSCFHLVEVRGHDLVELAALEMRLDQPFRERRADADVDRPDGEVVAMPGEMLADVLLVLAVVRELAPEPDGDAIAPALGRLADHPFARLERDEVDGCRSGDEVDVVGDGQFGDATLHGQRGVHVDRHVAVRREIRVEMRVEGKIAVFGSWREDRVVGRRAAVAPGF